jgi:hypothetical protein
MNCMNALRVFRLPPVWREAALAVAYVLAPVGSIRLIALDGDAYCPVAARISSACAWNWSGRCRSASREGVQRSFGRRCGSFARSTRSYGRPAGSDAGRIRVDITRNTPVFEKCGLLFCVDRL